MNKKINQRSADNIRELVVAVINGLSFENATDFTSVIALNLAAWEGAKLQYLYVRKSKVF